MHTCGTTLEPTVDKQVYTSSQTILYRLPTYVSRHDLPSASRRRKMLPCNEEEVEALFYFIYNLYLTLYPIRTLSILFPNCTAVHGVGVAQAKPACKHTISTRKCYQYNTISVTRQMTCSILDSTMNSKPASIIPGDPSRGPRRI